MTRILIKSNQLFLKIAMIRILIIVVVAIALLIGGSLGWPLLHLICPNMVLELLGIEAPKEKL